jgi:hypothetical protein
VYYQFSIPSSAFKISVDGGATTIGSRDYYLVLYIMDSANFFKWENRQNISSVSTYDKVEGLNRVPLVAELPPGKSYYLVLDNTGSTAPETVGLQATLTYSQTRF